jgi:hypothetical protein
MYQIIDIFFLSLIHIKKYRPCSLVNIFFQRATKFNQYMSLILASDLQIYS